MAERTSIFETVQVGVEATPGQAVPANRLLQALSIEPQPQMEFMKFRPAGMKYKTIVAPNKEWMQAPLSGALTYTEIVYVLSSLVSYAAPVQQAATSAYLWTFSSDSDGPDTVKTFTVERGSSVRASKFANGIVSALELMFSRNGIDLSGQMLGNAEQDGITKTASPTAVPLVPVLPPEIDIFLADTHADLDSALALERAISVSWALRDRFGPFFPLATQYNTGFAGTVETEPTLEAKINLEADSTGMGLLTTARAGDPKFLRILATGKNIEDTYDYFIQIDLAGKVSAPHQYRDEDGLYAVEWTFEGFHDATWGKSFEIRVQNTLTAL